MSDVRRVASGSAAAGAGPPTAPGRGARRWGPLALRWAAVVAWAGVIFLFSSLSNPPGAGGWRSNLAHPSEYAALAVLTAVAVAATWRVGGWRVLLVAWAAAVAYAISDEVHQWFVPGRQSDPIDVLLDATGAAVGLAGWWLLTRRRA